LNVTAFSLHATSERDRVFRCAENDRDCCGRSLGRKSRGSVGGDDHVDLPTNLVNSEFRLRNLRRTVFNRHVLALGISGVLSDPDEMPAEDQGVRREQPDYRHRRLLRARRQRPALPPRRRREKSVRRPSKAE
jgi:hypothetical protein